MSAARHLRCCRNEYQSPGYLLLRREPVLLAADVSFVLGAGLVQLEPSIQRRVGQAGFVSAPLARAHRREPSPDTEVLTKDAHRLDAADRRAHGQAHGVSQRIFHAGGSLPDGPAVTAKALHSNRRDLLM